MTFEVPVIEISEGDRPTADLLEKFLLELRDAEGAPPMVAFSGFSTWCLIAQDPQMIRGQGPSDSDPWVELRHPLKGTRFFAQPWCKEGSVFFVVGNGDRPAFVEKTGLAHMKI